MAPVPPLLSYELFSGTRKLTAGSSPRAIGSICDVLPAGASPTISCTSHSPSSPCAPRCCVEPPAHASSPTCNTNSSGVSPDSPLLPCPRQHVSGCVHVLWTRLCRKTGDFLREKQCPVQPGFCTISYCSEPFLSHQREEGPTSSPHSPQTRDSESVNSPSEECRK